MSRFAFGDFVTSNKPIPNIVRGSLAQVTGFEVVAGCLFCTVILRGPDGKFGQTLEPMPAHAFTFRRAANDGDVKALLAALSK